MRFLFFDTETNGLPTDRTKDYKEVRKWPHILQIAWQVWDIEGTTQHQRTSKNILVKPQSTMVWNEESATIHKIKQEDLVTKGISLQKMLETFYQDAKDVDCIVAHNLGYDKPVLWAEFQRWVLSGRNDRDPAVWWPKQELCTMMKTINLCKIPSQKQNPLDPYKWPKLAELFTSLFPARSLPENLHDASQDVDVLVTCFFELLRRDVIFPGLMMESSFDRFFRVFRDLLATL
jgi:DNA polymerase-3 subunit epsilon